MSVSSVNYPQPVQVNGFSCRNCSDVDLAKKHIDPQHPKSGPYNVDAASDPTRKRSLPTSAVSFGGALIGSNADETPIDHQPGATAGSLIDISV